MIVSAQPRVPKGEWKFLHPSLKTGRSGCAAVAIDNKVYIMGGLSGWNGPLEVLTIGGVDGDTEGRNEGRIRSKMRYNRNRCAAAALGDRKIVVVGATTVENGNTAEMYDVLTDTWSEMPRMKASRKGCAAASLGRNVYVFGGALNGGPSAEVYNDRTRRWTALPAMPTRRSNCAAVAIDQHTILVLGGKDPSTGRALNIAEAYHADTQTWSSLPHMRTPRSGCAAAAVGGFVAVMGGKNLSTVEWFSTRTQTWTDLPTKMRKPRAHCAAVVVRGTKLIVLGGGTSSDGSHRTIEEFPLEGYLRSWKECVVFPTLPPVTQAQSSLDRADSLHQWAERAEFAMTQVQISKTEAIEEVKRRRNDVIQPLQAKILELQAKIEEANGHCQQRVEAVEQEVEHWMDDTGTRIETARFKAAEIRRVEKEQRRNSIESVASSDSNGKKGAASESDKDVDKNKKNYSRSSRSKLAKSKSALSTFSKRSKRFSFSSSSSSSSSSLEDGEAPDELCCKITGELMSDPIVAMDGHTYERSAMQAWFSEFPPGQNPRSPVTNELLPSRNLVPNHTVRKQCREFEEMYGEVGGGSAVGS